MFQGPNQHQIRQMNKIHNANNEIFDEKETSTIIKVLLSMYFPYMIRGASHNFYEIFAYAGFKT